MPEPLVSCIVPCFNGERYLDECLRSILGQTHPRLEVLVIDDGSNDNSARIAQRYGSDVRYHHQENRGPGGACNRGLALATGEFFAFLEQDDLWLPDKISRQLAEFASTPALEFCVSHIQNFWIPELEADARLYRDRAVMQPVPGYVIQTLMARRTVFDSVGRFDETLPFTFATEWFLRAREKNAVGVLISDTLARRRLHHDNFSRRHRSASHDQFLQVVKASLDRRRRTGPD